MATIKTQLLQALTTVLATASDIVTVKRFPVTPIRLDSALSPIAYIQDSVPEIREKNNRFYRGILELDILVFIALQSSDVDNGNVTFLDKADDIQGQIHDILHSTGHPELTGLAIRILERSVEKAIYNDQWGVLDYTIEVAYQHLIGNASSKGS